MTQPTRGLFAAYGVELEYMIVDAATLAVRPIADQLLRSAAGEIVTDVQIGDISWSNELVLHVIELKTTEPAVELAALVERFQENIGRINHLLGPLGARLMPGAMHPLMIPQREMRLWPHEGSEIYGTFDRVFDCRGHGWANLQSVHLNLPFADDEQFGRLHAAVRLLLPLLPALAASSPLREGARSGWLDTRLETYRGNAARVPSVSGEVIPEPVFTRADYEQEILQPMYRQIAPWDPEAILQHEWLNARGAIARWDRHTIEVRVLDVQECPAADLAICHAIDHVLRRLVAQSQAGYRQQQQVPQQELVALLGATIRDADEAVVDQAQLLAALGLDPATAITARELWIRLLESIPTAASGEAALRHSLDVILSQGVLARRMLRRVSDPPNAEEVTTLCDQLCRCLAEGRMLHADA